MDGILFLKAVIELELPGYSDLGVVAGSDDIKFT